MRLTAAEKLAREKKKRVELLLHCYRPSTKVKALEAERAAVADAVGVFFSLFIYNRMTEYLTKISVLFFIDHMTASYTHAFDYVEINN